VRERVPFDGWRQACRVAFDRWARLASGRVGTTLAFVWALAEATVWPLLPDFVLAPLVAAQPHGWRRLLGAAVAGSVLGGTVMFLFGGWAPEAALNAVRHLPLVRGAQIEAVGARLATDGALGYLAQPWSGISFKVWAVVGGATGLPAWQALPAFTVGRALRLALVAAVAAWLGGRYAGFLRDHALPIAAGYTVLFLTVWWQVVG